MVPDGPPDDGGRMPPTRPLGRVLRGVGGCPAVHGGDTLREKREAISDCGVEISAERADTAAKGFTKLHLHYTLRRNKRKET